MTKAKTTSRPIEKNGARPEEELPERKGKAGQVVLTTGEVIQARNALREISQREVKQFDLVMKIRKVLRELEGIFEDYSEERQKLAQEYGEKDDDGKLKQSQDGTIPLTDAQAFAEDHEALLNVEVAVSTTFEMAEFKELVEKSGLKPGLLFSLGDLVVD